MKVNPNIFKEYDIRGKYPKEINEKNVYLIAKAVAKFLKLKPKNKVVVGYDPRPSSPKLAQAFSNGITDSGIGVINLGKVSTPMLYFSVSFLQANAGAMITSSHNPKIHNGVKLVNKGSAPIGGKDLQKIYAITQKIKNQAGIKKGGVKNFDIKKDYLKAIYGDSQPIKSKVQASFDYDADRLLIKNMRGDIVGGIIGEAVVKKGEVIVYDLRCTKAIPKYFENKGARAVPSRVGHFNIKKTMRVKKAVFGMELTGHYYFKDFYYCESPLYALKILNEEIKKTKKTLKELARPFTKYSHTGIIEIKIKNFDKVVNNLKRYYKNAAQDRTDGLMVEFSNWWFNIRPSHTEPLVTLTMEANSQKILEQKKKELSVFLGKRIR